MGVSRKARLTYATALLLRAVAALVIGVAASLIAMLLWQPASSPAPLNGDLAPRSPLEHTPSEPGGEPPKGHDIENKAELEQDSTNSRNRAMLRPAPSPSTPQRVVSPETSAGRPQGRPYVGVGLASPNQRETVDHEFVSYLTHGIPHLREVVLSSSSLRSADRSGRIAWDESLPERVLLVEVSTAVESAGNGRFRSETTVVATMLIYPDASRRIQVSAFGAGFSRSEAESNSKLKAAEDLLEQVD